MNHAWLEKNSVFSRLTLFLLYADLARNIS